MNLPEEIRNKEFGLSFRGYNVDEVEDYIEDLLERYDAVYSENVELAERNKKLEAALEALKKEAAEQKSEEQSGVRDAKELLARVEASARELIIKAQAEAKLIKDKAAEEAEKILLNAKEERARAAEEIKALKESLINIKGKNEYAQQRGQGEEISAKVTALKDEYSLLKKEVEAFRTNLYKIYSSHIQRISEIEIPSLDEETELKKKETVSGPGETFGYEKSENDVEREDFSELLKANEGDAGKENTDGELLELIKTIKPENENPVSVLGDAALKSPKSQSFQDVKERLYKAGATDKR